MTGTHYTLDRDRDENQNPMDRIKEKACRTCGTVKPNTFKFFGKKLWKTRVDLTTNEVCLACQKAKTSATMKAKWAARKQENDEYTQERVRMARAAHEAQELAKAQETADTLSAQAKAEERLPLDGDDDEVIKPISLEESLDFSGSEVTHVYQEPETMPLGRPAEVRVETDSERLMRELLEKP